MNQKGQMLYSGIPIASKHVALQYLDFRIYVCFILMRSSSNMFYTILVGFGSNGTFSLLRTEWRGKRS